MSIISQFEKNGHGPENPFHSREGEIRVLAKYQMVVVLHLV